MLKIHSNSSHCVLYNTDIQQHTGVRTRKAIIADTDSVRISLLTCAPGTEVYSLYGHTAVRYTDYGKI